MIVTPCELRSLYIKEIVLIHDYTLMVIIYEGNCACIKDPSTEGTRPSKRRQTLKGSIQRGYQTLRESILCEKAPKMRPGWPKMNPRWPQEMPTRPHKPAKRDKKRQRKARRPSGCAGEQPRCAQQSPRCTKDSRRQGQEGPETAQKKPHGTPKAPLKHPKESIAR